ncbi:tetratricopeptide repeat protein [Myxococcota bacterium]|nr:tetratricopeptide repeat protein [Myxococcota bacterium]
MPAPSAPPVKVSSPIPAQSRAEVDEDLSAHMPNIPFFHDLFKTIEVGEIPDGGAAVEFYLDQVRASPAEVYLYWKIGRSLKAAEPELRDIWTQLGALSEANHGGQAPSLMAHHLLFGADRLDESKGVDFKLRDIANKSNDPAVIHWQIQRLLETNKWRNVQQMIIDQLGGDPNEARVYSLQAMAMLAEERMGDENKAADFWRQVQQSDKGNLAAISALIRLYERLEKWANFAEVLKLRVDAIPDEDLDNKLGGLRRLVALYQEHINQDATLVALYTQILELDPNDEEAAAVLIEKYEALRRWPDLIALLQNKAEQAEGEDKIELYLKLARLYLDKLRNQNEAITAYEKILEFDPDQPEALEALDQNYEKRRAWPELIAVRFKLINTKATPEEQLAAYKEFADYGDKKIRVPEICLTLWEKVRELSPEDVDALAALAKLYEQNKDWEAMIEVSELLVEAIEDPKEKTDLLQKVGLALQERIEDQVRAVEVWQRLLDIDMTHRRAGDSLKKLLVDMQEWDQLTAFFDKGDNYSELVRILEGQVGVQTDDAIRIELLFRAAKVWEENLQQKDRAVRALERVMQIDAANIEGARALEPIYTENEDHRKLGGILEVLLNHEEAPTARGALMLRLAALNEGPLRKPDAALDWLRSAIQEDPASAEIRAELERLGGQQGSWDLVHDQMVAALEHESLMDPAPRLEALLSLGRLLDVELSNLEGALVRYQEALDIDGENATALNAIEDIHTRAESWPELLDIIERKLSIEAEVEERKRLLKKQGGLYEAQLSDPLAAIERYQLVLGEDEFDEDALAALHRLYEQGEQFEDLHAILLKELELAEKQGKDLVEYVLQVGLLELRALGYVEQAIARFKLILDEHPDHPSAREALESLLEDFDHRRAAALILEPIYQSFGEWEPLVAALEIQIETTEEAPDRVALFERVGQLQIEQRADMEAAFDAFSRLLREAPQHALSIERLSELAEVTDKWTDLAQLIEEILGGLEDEALAKAHLARLAIFYEEKLEAVEQAIDAHCRVLELVADDRLAIDCLERLYLQVENWPELLSIYQRKLALLEALDEQIAMRFLIAELLEQKLLENQEAILVYNQILADSEENQTALAALDRLYRAEEMWTELAANITRQLELAEAQPAQIALKIRFGKLHEVELGEIAVAVETYREILEVDPDNEVVIEALEGLIEEPDFRLTIANILEPIHESHETWDRLINVYEIQIEETEEATKKIALLHRIAELDQNRMGDIEAAFQCYARAFAYDPSEETTLSQLHTIAEALDLWEQLVEVYRAQVDDIQEPAISIDVHKRTATVLLRQLERYEDARGHYEAAYEQDNSDLESIEPLSEIYFHTEQWPELISVLLQKSTLTEGVDEKKALFFRVSALYEERLEDLDEAIATYHRVLELDEKDQAALDALERLLRDLERWDELKEVLLQELALSQEVEGGDPIHYKMLLAGVELSNLDQIEEAISRYKEVLDEQPSHAGAIEALEGLFQDYDHRNRVALILEPIYRDAEEWPHLIYSLEVQRDEAEAVEARVALLERIGVLHQEKTADLEKAFDAFARLLREAPSSEIGIEQLKNLADVLDGWAALAQLLEEITPDIEDVELGKAHLALLGEIYETRLENDEQSIDALNRLLELDADHLPTIINLERLYSKTQSWNELLLIYRRKLELLEPVEEKIQLQFQIANLLEVMLGEHHEAIEVYGEILQATPEDTQALESLDRLYGVEAMWPELADILERRLALIEALIDRVPLMVRLGGLHERELSNIEVAVETYKAVLEIDAQNVESITALEGLIKELEYQKVIADILEPIYETSDEWQKLIMVYEIQREESADEQEKVKLLHQIADLHQSRGADAEQAFKTFARAFAVDPAHEETLTQLHTLAEAMGFWGELVEVYEAQVSDISDVTVLIDVRKRVARVYRDQLEDFNNALVHFEEAHTNDDTDMEVIDALDQIYLQTQQWPELVRTLLRKSELVEPLEEKKALLFRVSVLYEEIIEDAERAVDIYTMVLELDAADHKALDALERIFIALTRWEDLIEVLQKKIALAEDIESKKAIYVLIGATYETELVDLTRAVETYQTILELDPVDLHGMQSLERLFNQLEQWEDLLEIYTRHIEIVADEDEQIALKFQKGRVLEVNLVEVEKAIAVYKEILDAAPTHEPTLAALEGLIREDREAEAVIAVLEPVLIAQSNWARAIEAWRSLLTVVNDLEERTRIYAKIGQAYEEVICDDPSAFMTYGQAFNEDPTHLDNLTALERISERAEDWAPYAELLEARLGEVHDPDTLQDLYLRLSRTYEERIGDFAQAIDRFRRVLEIDPDHEEAILSLDRLYLNQGQWVELAEILQLEVERAEGEAQIPLYLRLGALNENNLNEINRAIEAYREVLSITEGQPDAIAALEGLFAVGHERVVIGEILQPFYEATQAHQKLHDLLKDLVAFEMPGEDKMRAMQRLAEIALEQLEDKALAFGWFGEAFKEVPEDERSREELTRLGEETAAYAELITVLQEGFQKTQDVELIRDLCHQVALLYRHKLQDDGATEQMYQYVLQSQDDADLKALAGLDELFVEQARWGELVEILQREIDVTYDDDKVIVLKHRLGQLYEQQLGDLDAAVEQYQGVLERDPFHAEALARLAQIYEIQGAWEPLFDIYGRQAENAEAEIDKSGLYSRQAILAAQHLQRAADAIDLWNQVLDISGENQEALVALEGLYQNEESWRELVDVCERQINLIQDDPARELALYAKLGLVWGEYLERERNALENWFKVLERDAYNEDALWAIKGLYERTEEHAEIAQTIHSILNLIPAEDERRLSLYRELSNLYQNELDQPQEAVKSWMALLSMSPQDLEAIDALEELFTALEDWSSCVEILDRKAELIEDVYERISILFRIAEMWEKELRDAGGAQSAYQRILELQPSDLDAFQQLERLYQDGMQWEELVNLLLSRLEQTQDAFERQEIFLRTAKTFEEKLGHPDNAFLVLGQAFDESRDDESFGEELERLADLSQKWPDFVALYENVINQLGATPESIPLRLRVAEAYTHKLDQAQHAGTHYQYILSIEPENLPALTALEVLLEAFENWAKVAEVLYQKIELLLDPDERRESLVKLGKILEERLNQSDQAIVAYQQVLQIEPEDAESLTALERLYTYSQRWEELVGVLEQQAAILQDQEQVIENYLRVGELWEGRLSAPERAVDAYRRAIAVDEQCLDAMKALEKLFKIQERWHELLDVYEMMLALKTDPLEQLNVYRQIALIQEEEMSDTLATIDTYRKMLLVDATDGDSVRALDRLYRAGEHFNDLADVYQQHLEALTDHFQANQVRVLLGQIYQESLGDAWRAIDVLVPVLETDAENRDVIRALGQLYSKVEDWASCIDMMSREAHMTRDHLASLELHDQIGRIYKERLNDLNQAKLWYTQALELDKNHIPSLTNLKEIQEQQGDWQEMIRTLKMLEAANRSFEQKSQCLYEIGAIYDQRLYEKATGIDYYEQAIDLHPENVNAARPLVGVYWQDERWERAEPLLELIINNLPEQTDIREQQTLFYRLAFCAEQLHRAEKALSYYQRAYEVDSTHLETLQGMSRLLFNHEQWESAFKIYQTILVHHRENLQPEEIVDIFYKQGAVKLKSGERRKAIDSFRKALSLQPDHLGTLKAIIELHESQNDWDDVIHYKNQLLGLLSDETEKFQLLISIGDVLNEQLRNTRLAIDAFNRALELQPTSKMILGKLYAIYESGQNWNEAVDILTRLAEQEDKAAQKAKYFYAVAAIQKDYLKDNFTAVRSYDKALDANPNLLKAFQAIDNILTAERDYERQDRYYRKMLKRATDHGLDDRLIVNLARNLGEINRSRLHRHEEAIKAYKIALSKQPDHVQSHRILAELFELNNQLDMAVSQYYRLIELEPRNVESYQHLRRLFMDSGKYDEAWCVCQVLTFLGQASQDEQAFFEKYRSRSLTQANKKISNEHWALINHSEKSILLDQLFMGLYDFALPLMVVQSVKKLGIHPRKNLINPQEATTFNNAINYVAKVTGLQRLECFTSPAGQMGLHAIPLNPPALMVGADILSGQSVKDLAFISSKKLYMMVKQYFLASIDDTYEMRKTRLTVLIYTLTKLVDPQANVPDQYYNEEIFEAFRRIDPVNLGRLHQVLKHMRADPNQHLNISKWLEMVEHSANRLGFLLANDLQAAAQVIKNEPKFSRAPTQDRIRELVVFAISEDYFKLRKALGYAIG